MPDGYEFCESINGVVSVRRVPAAGAPHVPAADLAAAEKELARLPRLARHRVAAAGADLVVYEPDGPEQDALAAYVAMRGALPEVLQRVARRVRPVLKLVPSDRVSSYALLRVTYRGRGGWSYPIATGTVAALLRKHLPLLGTDAFFDLY